MLSGRCIHSGEDRLEDGRELAGSHGQDAARRGLLLEDMAGIVEQCPAQRTRTPVDRDEAHRFLLNTTGRPMRIR